MDIDRSLLEAIEDGVKDDSIELFAAIEENVREYFFKKIEILKLASSDEQKKILDKLQDMLEKE